MRNTGNRKAPAKSRMLKKFKALKLLYQIVRQNRVSLFLACLVMAGGVIFGMFSSELLTHLAQSPVKEYTVVLDAGHGGEDPGKVSSQGILEKDVNLAITLKCSSILRQNGIHVVLTRDTDTSLEDPGSSNKKAGDLKNRKQIITGNHPDCAVSIHQNSFPDESQHGSQVFFQTGNEDSKRLASLIQARTRYVTSDDNRREVKANSDYYLLKNNPVPTVIAEICFLSNPEEAAMITEEYVQERAAFAIAMGIMQYLYS